MPDARDRGESPPEPDVPPTLDESTVRRIQHLPREVGIMLVSVGTLGLVLPGLVGTPALIAGGLVLWPGTFRGVEGWLRRRNPDLYHRGMKQLGRFLDDLERRYPEMAKK
jgi:hypothetical protein